MQIIFNFLSIKFEFSVVENTKSSHKIFHFIGTLTIVKLITRNTCLQQPLAFISKHCVNMKYFGLYQQCTQAHFARVMLTVATRLTTELSSYKMCKVGMLL